jgi:microcompartment protein CcmL/EutN
LAELPALALIEFASIAAGTRASDALAKKATVSILRAGSLQPGKYAILFAGQVAEVEESYLEANRIGAESVVDRVLLPDVDRGVHDAILGRQGDWAHDTIGIIETPTLAAVIEAADAAVKGASVEIVQIRLGDGLGGKGLAHFAGIQADVEAAIEIGTRRIAYRNQTVCTSVIPRFDADVQAILSRSTRFGEGW